MARGKSQAPRTRCRAPSPDPARTRGDLAGAHRTIRHRLRRTSVPQYQDRTADPRQELLDRLGHGAADRPLAGAYASPLARVPYDLRHAAVSTWLAAGVPPQEVAKRAGHTVDVLLKVYAKCLDGEHESSNNRIAEKLDGTM